MNNSFSTKRSGWLILLIAVVIIGIVTSIDLVRISGYKPYPLNPKNNLRSSQDKIYFDLVNNKSDINWGQLDESLEFIEKQYDCSDFRLVNIIRIIYEYPDKIPADVMANIEKTLLGFRYWWDEPGGRSKCYWSENHQILFASAEYLIGKKFPDRLFFNSTLTGREHAAKARLRILDWMEMRWKYGFTEFYSNVYYTEDIGGMINLIDLAGDREIVEKMKIIMDLLLYDVAVQNTQNMFISVSGRAYERNRKGGPRSTLGGITNFFWGDGACPGESMVYSLFHSKNYTPPPVLSAIAKDTGRVIIKQSNGLDIRDLKKEGFEGTGNKSMMMQLGMEAFSNPEVIRNTLAFVRQNQMFSNGFLTDLKLLDFTILRILHLEPFLIRLIDPQTNGVAIQRGNTYTYKSKNYAVYSVQDYQPGDYGDQQHVSGMNVGNNFAIFHTHPAIEPNSKKDSPSYWVGYGHLPHVAQDQNISLAIYNAPKTKGLMEKALPGYTHAYFPGGSFDTIVIKDNFAFGKKNDTYAAFICKNPLKYREDSTDDLIQQGKKTFWITEGGSSDEDGTFDQFRERILRNELTFDPEKLQLNYQSKGKKYELTFKGAFRVDNQKIETDYDRFDSPWCKAEKKADNLHIQCNGKSLNLNFNKMERKF